MFGLSEQAALEYSCLHTCQWASVGGLLPHKSTRRICQC